MCITESQHFISTILKKIKLKKNLIFLVAFITMLLLQKIILQWNSSCYEESNLHAPNCQVQLTLFVVQFTQLLGSFCMVECSVLLDTLLFFDFRISLSLILFLLLWFLLSSLWYFILLTWWSHWSLLQLSLGLSFLSS